MIIIGIAAGMMLVSIAKSSLTIQSFGVTIMIISMLMSAQLFPIYIIKANDVL